MRRDPEVLMPDLRVTIRTSQAGDPRPNPNRWTLTDGVHRAVGTVDPAAAEVMAEARYVVGGLTLVVVGISIDPPQGSQWAATFGTLPVDTDVTVSVTASLNGEQDSAAADSKTAS